MNKYDLVIFDWDGTLMDSIGKIVNCMQAMAKEIAVTVPSEQDVRDIIGLSMERALQTLFPDHSQDYYQDMIQRYRAQYLEFNATASPLFHGSEELLVELKQQGYQLAIATGKARAGLNRILTETQLGHHFSASRCADETKSKPEPNMIHEILDELNVPAERAVMIGDSLHDLNMANNAGVHGIGVSYGAHSALKLKQANPVHIVDSPLELLKHL